MAMQLLVYKYIASIYTQKYEITFHKVKGTINGYLHAYANNIDLILQELFH